MVQAFLLETIARDALGDAGAAERALEHHAWHRTTHGSLISELLSLQAGGDPGLRRGELERLEEPLSESETRVLRYLPTNLSNREIADELYVSVNTVKAHIRHLYAKLDSHRRGDAVDRARALGLLAPSRVTPR